MKRRTLFAALGLGGTAMATRSDDLAPLFTAQPSGLAIPMMYQQGIIQTFDQITLSNTVLINRTLFTDLPVLGVAEAASYRPGTVVGVVAVESSWAIIGQLVTPGTQQATDAITQTSQRRLIASVATAQQTFNTSYVDLATVGPQVANVRIPASGRALVTLSSTLEPGGATAGMSVELSGGASVAADDSRSLFIGGVVGLVGAGSRVLLFDGLPAGGLVTFTAKYRGDAGGTFFRDRVMIVELL